MRVKNKIFWIVIAIFLLLSMGFALKKIYCRAIVTNNLENDAPINDLKRVAFGTEKIILFTYWYNLKPYREYEYKVAIFDGKKNVLLIEPTKFTPPDTNWHTLTTYKINHQIDKQGKWLIELYLDNKLIIKKSLDVREEK